MTVSYNGTSDGQAFYVSADYTVAYASATTLKVSVAYDTQASTSTVYAEQLTAWVLRNGTILAVYTPSAGSTGANLTGTTGQQFVLGVFAGFFAEANDGQSLVDYTSSSSVHSTGTSKVTLGPTTMTVTNYVSTGIDTISNTCTSDSLQSLSLSVGKPAGSGFDLITHLVESGSFTSGGTTTTGTVELQIESVTVA